MFISSYNTVDLSELRSWQQTTQLGVISWQLAVGSYQLSVGSWQLIVISYQLSVGSWELGVISWQLSVMVSEVTRKD